jgi:hypothetical protein
MCIPSTQHAKELLGPAPYNALLRWSCSCLQLLPYKPTVSFVITATVHHASWGINISAWCKDIKPSLPQSDTQQETAADPGTQHNQSIKTLLHAQLSTGANNVTAVHFALPSCCQDM